MTNKPHPHTVMLIEITNLGLWRLTARQTTDNGLRKGQMPTVACCEHLEDARELLRGIKHGIKRKEFQL